MRILLLSLLVCFLFSCETKQTLKPGLWRGQIDVQGQTLAMNFEVLRHADQYQVNLINMDEKILLDEIEMKGDSVIFFMHIFDTEIHARINGEMLTGYYTKNYEVDFKLPFTATYGQQHRYAAPAKSASVDYSGRYAVEFYHEGDTTVAVAIFNQQGNEVTGTFLTPTGDYRYLQGNVVDDQLLLSTFDGNHAFVFKAFKQGDNLQGDFWNGNVWHETWTASKDENAMLPDEDKLTFLKAGYDKIDFQFPDLNGEPVSPADERFRNKVLILQIFGTWCPNCMDETKFLADWYKKNHSRGVEILGLAYEAKDDFIYASGRVKKMKAKLDVPYDFVIAGNKDKVEAGKTLPMLNHILSFPTTIFIGKDGLVKRIHTGFTGPGTGVYYEQFIQSFNETVNTLLAEDTALSKMTSSAKSTDGIVHQ